MNWYKIANKELIDKMANNKGYIIDAYHGTSNFEGNQFKSDFSAQGVFWFSESKKAIESGESGALGTSKILHVKLKANNPAGWDEYDKYYLDQIRQKGFDSIHLDNNWIIFNPEQIKLAAPVTYDDLGNPIPLEKRFDSSNPDMRY